MSEPETYRHLSPTERVFALAEDIEHLAQQLQRTSAETRGELALTPPPTERRRRPRD